MGMLGTSVVPGNPCTMSATHADSIVTVNGTVKGVNGAVVAIEMESEKAVAILHNADKLILNTKDGNGREFSASGMSIMFSSKSPRIIGIPVEIQTAYSSMREYPRYPYTVDATVRNSAADQWRTCKTVNVSLRGVAVKTVAQQRIGAILEINIYDIYKHKEFAVKAEVRHVTKLPEGDYFTGCQCHEVPELTSLVTSVMENQLKNAMDL